MSDIRDLELTPPHQLKPCLQWIGQIIGRDVYIDTHDDDKRKVATSLLRNLVNNAKTPLHGEQMLSSHFRGVTENGQKFFFCPVGQIVSWSAGDYDNKWCHFEGKFVEHLV